VKSLASLGEFPFIEAIARRARSKSSARGVVVGIGDDAAQLRLGRDAIVTVDTLIEGVHFRHAWLSPTELGRRAFRVAVSDIAASGADPRFVLLALAAPAAYPARDALALVRGLVKDARSVGVALVGGNVARSPVLALTVTVIGERGARFLARDRARVGDLVYVTGPLGGAASAVKQLERTRRSANPARSNAGVASSLAAYRKPPLRVATASALGRLSPIGAAIDVSDGLVQDLGHICSASQVSAAIEPTAVPVARGATLADALYGGDDYELLFTVRPGAASERAVAAACSKTKCRAVLIGRVVPRGRANVVSSKDGRPLVGGYAHFARFSHLAKGPRS
jgi:thiamine-monophosphate kinase